MSLRVTYCDDSCWPIGTRELACDEKIIDQTYHLTTIYGEFSLENPKPKMLTSVSLHNYRDEFERRSMKIAYILSVHVNVQSQTFSNPLRIYAFKEIVYKRERDIAWLFYGEITHAVSEEITENSIRIQYNQNDLEIEYAVDSDLTARKIEDALRKLDQILNEAWQLALTLPEVQPPVEPDKS